MELRLESSPRRPSWPLGAVILALLWLLLGSAAVCIATEATSPLCHFKRLTGWPCPTCGATRGFLALLEGRVAGMWLHNPLLFTALAWIALLLVLRLVFATRPRVVLTRRERAGAWALAGALFLANWAWVIAREG